MSPKITQNLCLPTSISITALIFFAALLSSIPTLAIAPVLGGIEGSAANYTEGNATPTTLTSTLTLVDIDSPVAGALVRITGNLLSSEDVLSFTPSGGITGIYDASSGTLTLSGSATAAAYLTVLKSVRYLNSNTDNPSTLARTISISANDASLTSNIVARNITITAVNDAPVISNLEATAITFTEGDAAGLITTAATVVDVDNTNLASAKITVTNYTSGQDVIAFANGFGITGAAVSVAGGVATLNLTGATTVANYQSALRTITYQNTNTNNPVATNHVVTITVYDGALQSAAVTRTVTVVAINDAPGIGSIEPANLTFTEGDVAKSITAAITTSDVDSPNLNGAIVQITNNLSSADVLSFATAGTISGTYDGPTGTLTMTGVATLAQYATALRNVKFFNASDDPSTLQRTISFSVRDASDLSTVLTRNITFVAVNDKPTLTSLELTTLAYTESDAATPISNTIVVTDLDNSNLASATVQFSVTNYKATEDVLAFTNAGGITGSWNSTTRTLTLTGSASVADYQAALRTVSYKNTNDFDPSTLSRSVTFIVSDGSLLSTGVSRNISITNINDAPVLAAIETTHLDYNEVASPPSLNITTTLTLADDNANLTGAIVQVTSNYLSTEDVLTWTNQTGITGAVNTATGTVTFTGTGTKANYLAALKSVRYKNSNIVNPSSLTRTVTYSTTDGSLTSNIATRDIAVIVKDKVTTQEEVAIDIDVLSNDHDLYAAIDPTTVAVVTPPLNGTATVNTTTGIITYTPNNEFTGSNSFTYNVKDINGSTSVVKTVVVTVTLINDAPIFTPGPNITVSEDAATQTVIGWATGIDDGDPFTPQTVTFVLTNDNTTLFSSQPSIASNGNLTFKPNANKNGLATVTVYLRDNGAISPAPNVNVSATKTFTISVLSVNDAPVGVDEFYSTSSNTPLTANALTNDTDTENNTLSLAPAALVAPTGGSVVLNSNGTFTYTPNSGFTGTDSFTYQVCDNGTDNGVPASRCGQAVVTITVNPPNTEWNIVGNNSIELGPDNFVLTPALNNQQGAIWNRTPLDLRYSFDLDLNAIFSAPGVVKDDGADGIVFVFQRDYTPPPLDVPNLPIYARGQVGGALGIGGITPSFAVEVDTYQNGGEIPEDHISLDKDGDVWNNIAGPVPAYIDGTNTAVNVEDGVWHHVKISWDNPNKTLKVWFDGQQRIVYTHDIASLVFGNDPSNVFWGFSSSTGGKNNYQAVKDIIMSVTNLPPDTGTDTITVTEDSTGVTSLVINDVDPEGGTVLVQPETKSTANGHVEIRADGTYLYVPNADFFGTDSFTYQVCDSYTPSACSTGTVTVSVANVQDAPVAVADEFSTDEDVELVVNCPCTLSNDYDVDGQPLTGVQDSDVSHGTLVFAPDGKFTYMPDQDYFGTDVFTYHVTDGIDNSASVTVKIHVIPVNDAPVAVNDALEVTEDIATLLPILLNDKDVDDALTVSMVTIVTPPSHGTITINADGILYTPVQDYFGPDVFTYTLKDPSGAVSNVAQVSIDVKSVNDIPVTVADGATTPEDQAVSIVVLANDSDVDNAIDVSSVKVVSGPAHGTIKIVSDGSFIYTPDQDYFGTDTFDYTVKDVDGGLSMAATVSITVTPVNDAPIAVGEVASTLENTSVDIHVVDNDIDVDNNVDPASVVIVKTPVHGIVTVSGGIVTYVPATDYLGEDSFTYTIQDPAGLVSNQAEVFVTIVPPNRAPNAVNDGPIQHRFLLDLTIDVLANDFDVDNAHGDLTIVSITQPNIGSVEIVSGMIVYHPAGTTSGTVTFTYTISDPAGLTDEAVVTIEYIYNPLTVSEGFSPNNDYSNDSWYILSIENYPNNNVKIFDRWGLMVYQKEHYENTNAPWDGRANIGQQSGKLLDQGTYYYMLDVGGEIKMLSGFVMIVR